VALSLLLHCYFVGGLVCEAATGEGAECHVTHIPSTTHAIEFLQNRTFFAARFWLFVLRLIAFVLVPVQRLAICTRGVCICPEGTVGGGVGEDGCRAHADGMNFEAKYPSENSPSLSASDSASKSASDAVDGVSGGVAVSSPPKKYPAEEEKGRGRGREEAMASGREALEALLSGLSTWMDLIQGDTPTAESLVRGWVAPTRSISMPVQNQRQKLLSQKLHIETPAKLSRTFLGRQLLSTEKQVRENAAASSEEEAVDPIMFMAEFYSVPSSHVAMFKLSVSLTEAEACMPAVKLTETLTTSLKAYTEDVASPTLNVQIASLKVDRGSVQCSRALPSSGRSLLQSSATASIELLVVFSRAAPPTLNLEELQRKSKVLSAVPLSVSDVVSTAPTPAPRPSQLATPRPAPAEDTNDGLGWLVGVIVGVCCTFCACGFICIGVGYWRRQKARELEEEKRMNGELMYTRDKIRSQLGLDDKEIGAAPSGVKEGGEGEEEAGGGGDEVEGAAANEEVEEEREEGTEDKDKVDSEQALQAMREELGQGKTGQAGTVVDFLMGIPALVGFDRKPNSDLPI